jgi:hypothetical protein
VDRALVQKKGDSAQPEQQRRRERRVPDHPALQHLQRTYEAITLDGRAAPTPGASSPSDDAGHQEGARRRPRSPLPLTGSRTAPRRSPSTSTGGGPLPGDHHRVFPGWRFPGSGSGGNGGGILRARPRARDDDLCRREGLPHRDRSRGRRAPLASPSRAPPPPAGPSPGSAYAVTPEDRDVCPAAVLSFRLPSADTPATIARYENGAWTPVPSKIEGDRITATVSRAGPTSSSSHPAVPTRRRRYHRRSARQTTTAPPRRRPRPPPRSPPSSRSPLSQS